MPQHEPETPENLSRGALLRINGLLLAACATLLTVAVGLAAYIAWDKHQLAQLKGSLLAQHQLQEALLASQASDHAPFPHLDPGVSYVLNPDMKQATWKTGEEIPYRINRIGLRGAQIGPRPEAVKRIALVGDSVLFGWRIGEQEKLASLLQAMADQRLGVGKYEFVTIAMPGWNIIDQDRFLRSHLGRINPDYIIWSIIRNDLIDSAGVVPPGALMSWNAPHKVGQQPFQFLPPATLRDAPAPAILSRWEANLRRIEAFAQEHQIPVSMLWWRERLRVLFDHVMGRTGSGLPVVYIPGEYRYDEKNWCVAFPDCHPTPWANRRLAIGLMDELARAQAIEAIAWKDDELAIVDAFHRASQGLSSPSEQHAFLQAQASLVPDHYSAEEDSAVLFGISKGKMSRNGMLLLRREADSLTLAMNIATLVERPGPAQSIEITVRSDKGLVATGSFTLADKPSHIRLDLPDGADYGLYQVEWQFAYAECDSPSACFSARLLDARLLSTHLDR